jgi:predicted ABC-type transport system involved in lysophospholipase L1 biosynthesis ATPase subunit
MVPVLCSVDFSLSVGESCVLLGPSGCGKTTLVHLLGGLLRPSCGDIFWGSHRLWSAGRSVENRRRGRWIGFVFQCHTLLPEMTVWENILFPSRVAGGRDFSAAAGRAEELLDRVGLLGRRRSFPRDLSGGEQQRVAIARALLCRPQFLLADEPTGSLDGISSASVRDLLFDLCGRDGSGLLIVTHDALFIPRADRTVTLEGGHLR